MTKKNILVIRRDNIGDLICTTPLISNLRKAFPDANIDVLVNSYNAPVIQNNPDINCTYVYKKAKHSSAEESKLKIYFERFKTYYDMRKKGIDVAILAGDVYSERAMKVAKLVGAKQIIGYAAKEPAPAGLTAVKLDKETTGSHQVEIVNALAKPLGVELPPPACSLTPSSIELKKVNEFLQEKNASSPIGLHISARKPSNRWTEENYVQLIHKVWNQYQRPVMLFWSPGSESNPYHPGNDELACSIKEQCKEVPLVLFPTQQLEELIAGISVCTHFICSDGGAMHIAAALGHPILCFFGDSDAKMWHPWGVPYRLIQKETLEVSDINVDIALSNFEELIRQLDRKNDMRAT